MKIKMNIEDLTLRSQLSKLKCGYGDDNSWCSLNDKQLKEDFLKTLNYYQEQSQYLNKNEKEYLKELENVKTIVYGDKEWKNIDLIGNG